MSKKTTLLLILDGYGISDMVEGNAISLAKTPNIDMLMEKYPYVKGNASGLFVGLPDGQMGNSEVGHLNIGAGRVVYQELTKISLGIKEGWFYKNEEFLKAIADCKANDSALHLMGLLSDGGVHSHIEHLFALLKLAKDEGLTKVFVHAFLDGRDTPPSSGESYIKQLEDYMKELGVGKIATVSGRYYGMDRDNRWDRVQLAYDAVANGAGNQANSAWECIADSYKKNIKDEFVIPTIIMNNDMPTATINENDSVIFFNFRPDRAREITRSLVDPDFSGFSRKNGYYKLTYVCFTEYDKTIPNVLVAFKNQSLDNTFGEYISSLGMTQLRIAETEKYAHVTFFFNGGREVAYKGEERQLVQSPKVATYDLEPEMSANEVGKGVVDSILSEKFDVIICNFANADMVGHTGIIEAAIKAVETVDTNVGKIYNAIIEKNGQMFICADHGNADKLVDYETGEVFTAHTTNPVPFILVNCKKDKKLKEGGSLCDIAPTLLDMMDIKKPEEMTGQSLLI